VKKKENKVHKKFKKCYHEKFFKLNYPDKNWRLVKLLTIVLNLTLADNLKSS